MVAGLVPQPVFDSLVAAGLARTLTVAAKVGVFEALQEGGRTGDELARRCETDPEATHLLLGALAASGYVRARAGGYELTPMSRKWIATDAKRSLADFMKLMPVVWGWLAHYETFVRTGEPLDVHDNLTRDDWRLYQRGMRSLSTLAADEFGLRTKLPPSPRRMLDIGGSHGLYSAVLCRKHPSLHAVVLDLPAALEHAEDLHRAEGLGERISARAGDARTEDLGEEEFDIVLISNLVHHFDEAQNLDLFTRVKRALRPGGVLVVQEPERGHAPQDQAGALGALYFAALSASATWTFEQIATWQTQAGLHPSRPLRYLTVPGLGQQPATK